MRIMTKTRATELVMGADGAVAGVKWLNLKDNSTGSVEYIYI